MHLPLYMHCNRSCRIGHRLQCTKVACASSIETTSISYLDGRSGSLSAKDPCRIDAVPSVPSRPRPRARREHGCRVWDQHRCTREGAHHCDTGYPRAVDVVLDLVVFIHLPTQALAREDVPSMAGAEDKFEVIL